MSEFRRYLTFIKKSQRDQISELRKWSDSFSLSTALSQTKPVTTDTARPASPAIVVCDDAEAAVKVNDVGDEGKDDDDEVFIFGEDDHQLSEQIAKKEEKLLEIWEHGPAQLTASQDLRISYLEEKLAKTIEDNEYLEALLKVRDNDFARYLDLERQQRRLANHLLEEVDGLYDQLEEKDKSLKLALKKLDMAKKADMVMEGLILAQKQLAKSTVALVSKQRKTKLAYSHSVQNTVTRPRSPVQEEIVMAERREWERMREEQRKEIANMVNHVDRIAASFDRYQNISTVITNSEPRSEIVPNHLFTWVEQDMIATWLFSVDPTEEELDKYEKHLDQQMRPEPIYSPDLPKARVNWHRLNPSMKRNLPVPDQYPLYGCAQDPEFYTTLAPARYYLGQKMDPRLAFFAGKPFGSLYGFWTSKGVLAPPDEPVGGYHCCSETGTWIIAAEGG